MNRQEFHYQHSGGFKLILNAREQSTPKERNAHSHIDVFCELRKQAGESFDRFGAVMVLV